MFTPNSLIPGTTEVTVLYGGKYTTTPITMVDKAYILYYYNSTIKKVHSLYTYEGDESNVISALDNIISAGAVGFYRVSAKGYYDGYKKYNLYTKKKFDQRSSLSIYREENDGSSNIYIGATFEVPVPPTPSTPPTPPTPPIPPTPTHHQVGLDQAVQV